MKISIELVNALETLASMVTTLPSAIGLLKNTLFTETVVTCRRQCLLAVIPAIRSILANNSPPNICPKGLRSEEHTSELQSRPHLVCRLLLEKKKNIKTSKILLHIEL